MSARAEGGFWQRYGPLFARLLLVPLLLAYGVLKVRALMGSQQADMLQHFPITAFFVYLTIVLEIVGGVLLLVGYKTRVAAAVLAVFFFAVALLNVPQIAMSGGIGASYFDQMLKQFAFVGGLILLALHGAGPVSVDHRLRMREHQSHARSG